MAVMPAPKRRKLSPLAGTQDGTKSGDTQNAFYKQAAGWNLEQDYEQRSRKKKREKESTRLPIKTADGRIEQLRAQRTQEDDSSDNWFKPNDEAEEANVPVQEQPKVSVRQQILEAKEELARLATLINEDPEEHAGGFKALGAIASNENPAIKKLALATQLAVFKDVIPGYRIRPIAEENQTEKVSREVKRLRAFEQSLVSSYQTYLKDLAVCAKGQRKDNTEADASVAAVAIACTCTLLLAVPHFNFRGELLRIVVGKLSGKRAGAEFDKCLDTLVQFFHDDDDGTPSLDAVGLLARMMKAKNFQINETVLNAFLHLRLLSEFSLKASQNSVDKADVNSEAGSKRLKVKKEFRTKKYRKVLKERKAVEKDFKEADAIVSHEQRDRMQAETLKIVFTTYFRILKTRVPALTGAVLEGLAKYAHLINQDFFSDLLEALKDIIKDAEATLNPSSLSDSEDNNPNDSPLTINTTTQKNATRSILLSITTALALLEAQQQESGPHSTAPLNLDLTFFTNTLYNSLPLLSLNPDVELSAKTPRLPLPSSSTTDNPPHPPPLQEQFKINSPTLSALLHRALSLLLLPKSTPPLRTASFTKTLCTTSLHLPEKSALATLALLHSVAKTHVRKIRGLFDTEERRGDGVYDPYASLGGGGGNVLASTVWEGELLRLHYAPGVREGARGVEKVLIADRK